MRSRYVLVYVTCKDGQVHAVLTADPKRTVCGVLPAGRVGGEPAKEDICRDCWADWRTRGDEPRVRLAGLP